ncbi:sodium:proton antiporter [Bacillus sp. BRMEA1]|uniref:Na+/H+ antiporter NhaC family protein n=1 Tax=Neobacillus endophyticus TaxID=2738405 RepID=UPI001564C966|nr:Na+/H+ antiporter NhaC family protein [Neobacillus endophyticus]NRD80344.1 sodium:proton antiporter [Neobacillus endophyticus]
MNLQITPIRVFILFLTTFIGVASSVTFHFPLVIGFLPGYLVLVRIAKLAKFSWKQIMKISLLGIYKTRIVIIILFLVSFLLPSWYLSETIDQMVKTALMFITPTHFFVLSFLSAMIVSLLLGTTVGTLSAIGVPILGTAMVLHLPLGMAAGALVSGAFVGDRTSPFSSSHQLMAHTVEIPIHNQGKAMLLTSVIAVGCCFCFYGCLDLWISSHAPMHLKSIEWSGFTWSNFIPPLILILMVVCRISIIYGFLSSILSAAMLAILNHISILRIATSFWSGIPSLGGGLVHMYELLLFLALAGAFNGLLEELHVIQPYLDKWMQTSRSLTDDTFKTIIATLIISLIAANQTLPIILTGRSFLPHWSSKYGREELVRVMGDSTMLFPGIVPWSVLAIMCSTIMGVQLFTYLPFALFLWVLPFVTLAVSKVKQIRKDKSRRLTPA